jgi:hypothetical protein
MIAGENPSSVARSCLEVHLSDLSEKAWTPFERGLVILISDVIFLDALKL